MSLGESDIEAILELSPAERYRYFIERVQEKNEVWSLFDDGWATSEDKQGNTLLPLWPDKEFAELCITGHWATFKAKAIPMSEALNDMIPYLRTADILPGVFYVAGEGSVDVNIDELDADLRAEPGAEGGEPLPAAVSGAVPGAGNDK